MKDLKTLAEHDKERQAAWDELERLGYPHPNGIACPKCGKELWDSNPKETSAT